MKSAITHLFSLIFLLSTFSINSQTIIEGQVTDAKSGEPLLYSSVSIYKNATLIKSTNTDIDGIYRFTNIKNGIYDIEATYAGYQSQKHTVVSIKENQINTIPFTLEQSADLDEIIISKVKIKNTYSASDIRNLPVKNIAGIATSMDASYTSRPSSSGPIRIRGYRSGETMDYKPLPTSGQITAGEWNDLHNWKDWIALLDNEDYSIMTERFEIYPTQRYSVLAVNEANSVLPNIKVQLKNNGNIIWEAITDNSGKAELWSSAFSSDKESNYTLFVDGKEIRDPKLIDEGTNTVILKQECSSPQKMDIVFTVDATSSMNDEIQYLKSELLDVIDRIQETNEDIIYRTGSVFYRDTRDEYLTRISPLSEDNEDIISFVHQQNAKGGGDNPEAVDEAIHETLNLDWDESALKLVFLILDAPPHEDEATMSRIRSQIKSAARKGIKLIPITASGIGRETEFLMKFMAMMTNGTYIFITDDSGIGNQHLDPVVTDYEVEKLNDCMARLINLYSKPYSCDISDTYNDDIDIDVYPNPSTQYVNVKSEVTPTRIDVLSSNGMIVKSITQTDKITRIELHDLVNGVYTLAIYFDDTIKSQQIIVLR